MIKSVLKLTVKAQSATSGPPLGPALGQFGIPTMDFCKKFNELSKHFKKGVPLLTIVTIKMDRSYDILIKGPSTTFLIKSLLGHEAASKRPGYFELKNLLLSSSMIFELLIFREGMKNNSSVKVLKGVMHSCGYLSIYNFKQ
uniref:Ribosomal protein L11 n=1 Tax=Stachyamoeba lipophora TaxID=463046 RepID=A0A0B5GFZ1_STALP|nr:ribosomal protein L11 [Stachyamoeba lipophora]AJF22927.1 ribosomal protein L11 [Stachyamoeba lipophora]